MAGEIGHIVVHMHGRHTPEGRGTLESYVGNRQLVASAVQAIRNGRSSLVRDLVQGDLDAVTPKSIAHAAEQHDALALEMFDQAADCLAAAFASLTYTLQPEVFVVGGGVASSGRVLFDPLRRYLQSRLHPMFAERVHVVPAQLGTDAGIIGCATLLFQSLAG